MEKDTVCLSLKEYNLLRDIEKEVYDNDKIYCYEIGYQHAQRIFYTSDEAIVTIAEENKKLHEKNESLQKKYAELKYGTIFQFIKMKWRNR